MLDKDFQNYVKSHNTKKCPGCNAWTDKIDGCNHITCKKCKYEWCWLCLKKYESNHYSSGPCKGRQFEGSNLQAINNDIGPNFYNPPLVLNEFEIRYLRITDRLKRIFIIPLYLFGGLLSVIGIFVFGTSTTLVLLTHDEIHLRLNNSFRHFFCKCLIYLTVFMLGIIFQPFVLAILFTLVFLFSGPFLMLLYLSEEAYYDNDYDISRCFLNYIVVLLPILMLQPMITVLVIAGLVLGIVIGIVFYPIIFYCIRR